MEIGPMRSTLLTAMTLSATVVSLASAQMQMGNGDPANSPDPAAYGPQVKQGYERVRAATAAFRKLSAAVAAGYDSTASECYAAPNVGAMGYHHVNHTYVDKTLEIEKPEILLYERLADGSYQLNGVEYIVPYRLWPADSVAPRIMGRELQRADDLKVWYLHMWVWKRNSAGLFASWNPDAACRTPPA
jgi:hypothetical protein